MKYKIVTVILPYTDQIKYKLRIRKRFLGLFSYYTWFEYWDDYSESWKVKLFDSEEEAINALNL